MMRRHRTLVVESLEERRVLAAVAPFQNPIDRFDVNADGQHTLQDGLAIVQYMFRNGAVDLATAPAPRMAIDVDGNNLVEPRDVLEVVAALHTGAAPAPARMADEAMAEGEQLTRDAELPLNDLGNEVRRLTDVIRQENQKFADLRRQFWRTDFLEATRAFVESFRLNARDIAADVEAGDRPALHVDIADNLAIARLYRGAIEDAVRWNGELNRLQRGFSRVATSAIGEVASGGDVDTVIERVQGQIAAIDASLADLDQARIKWLRDIHANLEVINANHGVLL